jgi:hypothetical protein
MNQPYLIKGGSRGDQGGIKGGSRGDQGGIKPPLLSYPLVGSFLTKREET